MSEENILKAGLLTYRELGPLEEAHRDIEMHYRGESKTYSLLRLYGVPEDEFESTIDKIVETAPEVYSGHSREHIAYFAAPDYFQSRFWEDIADTYKEIWDAELRKECTHCDCLVQYVKDGTLPYEVAERIAYTLPPANWDLYNLTGRFPIPLNQLYRKWCTRDSCRVRKELIEFRLSAPQSTSLSVVDSNTELYALLDKNGVAPKESEGLVLRPMTSEEIQTNSALIEAEVQAVVAEAAQRDRHEIYRVLEEKYFVPVEKHDEVINKIIRCAPPIFEGSREDIALQAAPAYFADYAQVVSMAEALANIEEVGESYWNQVAKNFAKEWDILLKMEDAIAEGILVAVEEKRIPFEVAAKIAECLPDEGYDAFMLGDRLPGPLATLYKKWNQANIYKFKRGLRLLHEKPDASMELAKYLIG